MGSGPLHQVKSTLPPLVGYPGSDNADDPLPVPAGNEHDALTEMFDEGCGHAPYEEPGGEAAPAPPHPLHPVEKPEAVPPPPPPHPAGPALKKKRARGPTASYVMPDVTATINFYEGNNIFEATCSNPFHGSCVVSRKRSRAAQWEGRPVAAMYIWLFFCHDHDDKKSHWDIIPKIGTDLMDAAASIEDAEEELERTEDGKAILACQL